LHLQALTSIQQLKSGEVGAPVLISRQGTIDRMTTIPTHGGRER